MHTHEACGASSLYHTVTDVEVSAAKSQQRINTYHSQLLAAQRTLRQRAKHYKMHEFACVRPH
jgi:hypothetical protein